MAIDNQFGKGIGVAAGFDLGAQKPLDSRIAVNTLAERDAHIDNNRAYEGMLVYVDEDKNTYQLINGKWVVFFSKAANDSSAEGQAAKNLEQDNRLSALETKVGKDVDGENPAKGLFLEVDQARAAADAAKKAADDEASRAAEAEQALQGEIDAINNEENGILAQAKAHAEAKDAEQKALLDKDIADAKALVETEKGRAEGVEADLLEAINAINNEESGIAAVAKKYTDDREVEIRADIKKVTDALDERLQTAEGEIDDAQEDILELQAFMKAVSAGDVEINLGDVDVRIKALEANHTGENSVENKIAAAQKAADDAQADVDALEEIVGVEGKEAAEGQESVQATGLFKKIDDANAAIEEAMADDKAELEGKITKEAEDRAAADKAINDEIANMKNADLDGSLAKQIDDEAGRAAEEEGKLAKAIEDEAKRADAAEKANAAAVVTEKDRAEAKEAELLAAIEAEVGKEGVQGNRDKAIADAIAVVNGDAAKLEGRVKANEDAIAVINGEDEGSIKKAVADLVNGAPEAANTLKELADSIAANKGVYDGWVVQHEQAMAAMKAELQGEIDTDVKVVADELAKQKDAEQDGTLAKKIVDEAAAREAADQALVARVAANEAFVDAQPNKDKAQDDRLAVIEEMMGLGGVEGDKTALQELQETIDAVEDKADAAQAAADAAQNDVDALEGRLDDEGGLVARIAANEAFVAAQPAIDEKQSDDIENLQGRMSTVETFVNNHSDVERDKKIDANAAAIEAEVKEGGARDVAIATALEDYSTTVEMKSLVASVVASLSLELEDNKVSLTLGEGVEGVTLKEVYLNVATDDDIDAIIAGLDKVEGE